MLDHPSPIDPGDGLAQPTRARLFALLGELARPAGTAELAERLDLHPNGVRLHLERLENDGLLLRSSDPQPRGRPRDSWRIAPDANPGGLAPSAYRDLVRWLARAISSSSRGLREIEAIGREIGRELAQSGERTGIEAFQSALIALGFQPLAKLRGERGLTVTLRNCPYREAVHENQPAICTLHRGITLGLLDKLEPKASLADFQPRDPDLAGCLIELDSVAPAPRDMSPSSASS